MGGGGGRGKTKVQYYPVQQPQNDGFSQYLSYMQGREQREDARAAQERADRTRREEERRERGRAGFGGLIGNLQTGLQSNLISYDEAMSRAEGYLGQYDIGGYGQDQLAELTKNYTTNVLPTRRRGEVEYQIKNILGRDVKENEVEKYMTRFSTGALKNLNEFKQDLYSSTEYKDKNNQSYIDNYYDSIYGKQETDKDGKLTGKRTFQFSQDLMPGYSGDLPGATNVKLPEFEEYFKKARTVGELDEQRQNMRAARQFVYSSGLTNLQGTIDKEISKIRDKGETTRQRIKSGSEERQALLGGALSFY